MSVIPGQSISSQDYNNIQSRISAILGNGSGQTGYGQSVQSFSVSSITDRQTLNGDSVLANHLNNLLADFNTVYTHQTGSSIPINSFDTGDIVGADESGTDINYNIDGTKNIESIDTSKGLNDFYNIIDNLESNKFIIANNQQEIDILASDIRTSSWSSNITSIVQVTFPDTNARRYFFNAGGQIRFLGSVTNVTTQRGSFWNDLIENPGEVQFNYNSVSNSGSLFGVTISPTGNYNLSNSFQTIFRKDASSGIYSDSFWEIDAREDSSSSISFRLTLVNSGPESDSDAGQPGSIEGGITESVQADIEFEISVLRANGAVTIPPPSITITDSF